MEPVENLIADIVSVLAQSSYAIALTGAGISTESGIPDFRGPSGIWTKDPAAERRAYQSYERFLADPKAYWTETFNSRGPGLGDLWNMHPNPGHFALADLESLGILKCVITQNIDALHEKAGSHNVIEYHGNFMKLRCTSCQSRFWREQFDLERLRLQDGFPPRCPHCRGALKSDTVSFGEPIPADVAVESLDEARKCDVMLVCGTSAVVHPFAGLPAVARERAGVTIIEINTEPTLLTVKGISDYLVRGKTGELLPAVVEQVKRLKGLTPYLDHR